MQMILFFAGSDSTAAVLERPRKVVASRTVRSLVREPSVMLIDRPAPVVPMVPRQPSPLPDPASLEEEPERWDGLY